jgi:hypothetical protein
MAYFNFADRSRATVVGGFTANAAGEIQTGVLVRINPGGKLTLNAFNQAPDGFAEGLRQLVYAPTDVTLDAGEYCNVVSGKVLVRCDSSFFYGGTLPSQGDTIYAVNDGLMSTSGGVYKIGKCIKAKEYYRTPPNSSTETVLLDLTIGGERAVQ